MIYITQLIYVTKGKEEIFHAFEEHAIPIISKYNGRLLLRVRPDEKSIIASHIEQPYELHLVEFESQEDFENFKHDTERNKFLHLKDQSIRSSLLIQGSKIGS